ncbi:hypothetical protein CHLNCDRAFT_138774 [Chlorella variabilis]|uniref:Uncharacterized protein n=1 Tax=Chlorella variabilis TaxID=554065 RepID=E1ZNQ6_CHLVA|nr:hypothetical protein CHLNCDRAFT_138774 [Chlorella variabilis]EFN52359.1 hypothetical protein CHLNCDRAFT_138774 [Chlorella variabilis]|eukprot:XP_005844461.1 hypothetical protein CHLNCDRAFT_138774 [Chlorella variabilis]
MLNRLRSGRIHPDVAAAGGGPRSLSKTSSAKSFRRQVSGKSDAQREIDRSLAMSDQDHAAWLQDRVKHDGRKAAMALLKFYLRMLKPCVVVAAYVAAMYAAISWSIPNLLCNSIAKENSGSLVSGECIYIDTGNKGYSVAWGQKVFFLVFWTVQAAWMAGFCAYMTAILFGPAFRKRERMAVYLITLLAALINPICGPRFGLAMNSPGIILGTGVASFFNMLNTMNAPMRYSANPLNRLRWINMLLLASMVSNIYLFLIPMAITARSADAFGGMGITFLRLVVHPAMWATILVTFRFMLRNIGYIPEMRSSILLCWPLIYSSLYGRFLLLQASSAALPSLLGPLCCAMEGAGSVVMVNLLIAFVEIAGRLDDRSSDGLLLKLMYGERARDAITAARDQDEKRMSEVFMGLMTELTSIFAASFILSLGGVALKQGVPPDHKAIWVSAGLQAVTTLVSEFIGMAMEGKYHCFEWSRAYTPIPVRITVLILVMMTFGASRLCLEVIGIFCPTYYPDRDIILLEQCDKPSLFQAITFSSADRFKMIGSFFNYTDGVFNMTGGYGVNTV